MDNVRSSRVLLNPHMDRQKPLSVIREAEGRVNGPLFISRLPLSDLNGSVTQYKNELFRSGEEDEAESEFESELSFKNVTLKKDARDLQQELKKLFSIQRKKERSMAGMLVGSSDFLSPRSGCLTPPSSARAPPWSARGSSCQSYLERESRSQPNSSRDIVKIKQRLNEPPLPDSLRSRFSKHTSNKLSENGNTLDPDGDCLLSKGPLERKLLEQGITPIYDPKCCHKTHNFNFTRVLPDISDLRVFLVRPGPRIGGHIQCHIRRVVSTYRMYPRYKLYLTEGDCFLLSARKRKKSKSSNYIISLDEEDISNKTGNYFGNLRSNFLGTKFWFFDRGDRPTIKRKNFCYNRPTDRVELGAVMYEPNVLGMRGPRRITAMIPAVNEDEKPYTFDLQPKNSSVIIHSYTHGFNHENLVIMKNKLPKWNPELKAYCLNFNGRATQASVKNFQLVTEFDDEYIILQFGKAGKNFFTMDYQHPMSALQAFAICLSSLDTKLACE